ncbi:hypothetical protein WK25_23625 [Burkholderia latens]|nr:hypothetical protein WK25_23625 [Burkholderia latens]
MSPAAPVEARPFLQQHRERIGPAPRVAPTAAPMPMPTFADARHFDAAGASHRITVGAVGGFRCANRSAACVGA